MKRTISLARGLAICFALGLTALFVTTLDLFASEQTDLLVRAAATAENMKRDPAFGLARNMMDRAKGVLIVPSLVKGGFIFGAEGGNGILIGRNQQGWGQPAFYSMGSGSFGLQAGLEKAQIVMLIMSNKALAAMQRTAFKLGAGAGLTVITLSAGAEAATNLNGDIIIWTSATGVFGGVALNGSIIKPRQEWNRAYYGRDVTVADIMASNVQNPSADRLREELSSLG